MKNSSRLMTVFFALALLFSLGCTTVTIGPDDEVGSGQHALTAEDCQDNCMADFQACKESPDRGGGPGASACAHEKNACQKECK